MHCCSKTFFDQQLVKKQTKNRIRSIFGQNWNRSRFCSAKHSWQSFWPNNTITLSFVFRDYNWIVSDDVWQEKTSKPVDRNMHIVGAIRGGGELEKLSASDILSATPKYSNKLYFFFLSLVYKNIMTLLLPQIFNSSKLTIR